MKNEAFVNGMRKAGKIAAQVLREALERAQVGVSALEIDTFVYERTLQLGGVPAPLNYKGFPKSTCISFNEVLCHGIPDQTPFRDGDIVNIDITVILDGYHGDCSATIPIGNVSPEKLKLIEAAKEARDAGIRMVRPFGMTGDIGMASANAAAKYGFMTAPNLGGHGIGTEFHMSPHIPGSGAFGFGDQLRPWTCITVEPIVVSNPEYDVHSIPNSTIEWYTTKDKSPAAQFEHTVLITDKGYEILTI